MIRSVPGLRRGLRGVARPARAAGWLAVVALAAGCVPSEHGRVLRQMSMVVEPTPLDGDERPVLAVLVARETP